MPKKLNQKGVVHVVPFFLILAVLGIVLFLLITSIAPSQNNIFNNLFPKKGSEAATNQIYWGAYIEGPDTYGTNPATGQPYGNVPWDCNSDATSCPTWDLFQSHAGKATSLANVGFGKCWGTPCNYNFNGMLQPLNAMVARKNLPILTVGTWSRSDAQIASGVDDSWVTTFAQQAKAWGHPFMLRFDWEMNGNWFDWGGTSGNPFSNTPQDYVNMWRHVHDIFTAQGANNVTWVWCPNEEAASSITNGGSPGNAANYYPGDSYVDWTCFDVYNWGALKGSPFWRTWEQMAGTPSNPLIYQHLLQIAPTKPMMVGETASSETGAPAGTSKAAWETDMLSKLPTEYPQIKALSFFLWNILDGGVKSDWWIESSTASQQAFASGISSSYYASNTFGNIPVDTNGKIAPLGGSVTPTPSPTLGANQQGFVPVADTFISSDCVTCTNLGTAPYLYTDASSTHIRDTFLRFDLTAAAGKNVTAAILRIHTTSDAWAGSVGTQNVQYVNDNSWSEQFMDWNNQINPNAILATPIGSFSGAANLDTSYDIPLSVSNIQSHIGGLYSLMLPSPSNDNLTFQSREGANPPQLILTLSSPTPTATPTRSPTQSPTRTPTPTPIQTPSVCQGADIDKNGTVNIFDYNQVVTDFGKSGTNLLGDVNRDNIVNIFDYNVIVTNFGKTGC